MRVIIPTFVTDTILTASSILENDAPAWAISTGYAQSATVVRNHRRYQSVPAATNTGNDPAANDTSKWLDVGPTNRFAMFDQAKGSLATATGSITVTLAPGRINSLALLDLNANNVTVGVSVSGVPVYSRNQVLAIGGNATDNWYDWFFAPIGKRTSLLFDDLPSYGTGVVTVTIHGDSDASAVACGTILIGRMFDIGTTLSGAELGIDDYSVKSRDAFGVVTLVSRAFSDSNSYQVAIQSSRADAIKNTLASLRATPTIYIGEDGLDSLLTYGFFTSFRINLALLTGTSNCSIDVAGLV